MSDLSKGWDRHAPTYARVFAPLTGYLAQSLFQTVAGRLPPGPRILDVACGNGDLARAAALHCLADRAATGCAGCVVAIDLAPGMVALAGRNLGALDAGELVRCEVHDGQALALESGSFDAVLSAFGIFLFPDRGAGWREAARVLRPDGVFATAVWRGPDDNPLARLQIGPMMAALPERARAGLPRPGWLDIASAEGLERELASCGFRAIEISVFDAVLTVPTPRVMWEAMRDNPGSRMLLEACTDEELAKVEESVLATYTAMARGADRPVRFEASCHFAIARRG